MDVILDRIAAWAPRREVFQLFDIEDDEPRHVGTFSTLEKANAFLPDREIMVKVEYLDNPY